MAFRLVGRSKPDRQKMKGDLRRRFAIINNNNNNNNDNNTFPWSAPYGVAGCIGYSAEMSEGMELNSQPFAVYISQANEGRYDRTVYPVLI
jgi:hypothetical protein